MKLETMLLICTAIVFSAGGAFAATIPTYDFKATCNEIAMAGGGSKVIELQCRKDEEAAQKRLQKSTVSSDIIVTCDEVARIIGKGSYVILEQCIKDEQDAASQIN